MRRAPLAVFLLLASAVALFSAESARTVSLVIDPTAGAPTRHGVEKLTEALQARGWAVEPLASPTAPAAARGGAIVTHLTHAGPAESLSIHTSIQAGRPLLEVNGADDRGLMYALLDLAERIGWAPDAAVPFSEVHDVSEQPTLRDRSLSVYTMNRAYWESRFYDERYWTRYFDTLAANRFNRFLVVLGYENGGFLAPPYPYFFSTPGFPGVHMVGLSAAQQQANLAALNRLIDLAHARGIAVSLGIWDHIYRGGVQAGGAEWVDSYKGQSIPNSVEGVTTENLHAYTLASLKELLARVPRVDGLQLRIHEESGLATGEMDGFWREVFQQLRQSKPGLFVELRGKGTPDSVIDTTLAQGLHPRIETKFWMEQMGLPFHPTHVPPGDQTNRRAGYADFLRYPQKYEMDWRLWNGGTSRVLLWGDPDYVRRYVASAQLYGSSNFDVQEPLATKMEAQRPDQPVFDLMPARYRYYEYEFERYWDFFRLWGRLSYNPATPAEVWEREFARRFGAAAAPLEAGLARASQVLPMLVASSSYPYSAFPTTRGWAERQSLGASLDSYAKNTGSDPEQFESFEEAARRILAGGTTTKRTPDAVARWLHTTADSILASVNAAEAAAGPRRSREFDSTVTDLKILAQLARFHAYRSMAAIHYNLFKRGLRLAELLSATYISRDATAAWNELVVVAGDRYNFDLAMGARPYDLSGHWRDELVKLQNDLKELEAQCCPPSEALVKEKVWEPATSGDLIAPTVEHTRPTTARPDQPLRVVARVTDPSGVQSVVLRYRHVTQFEDYATLPMQPVPGRPDEYAATIPGDFLVPQWDAMYFISVTDRAGNGANWPDLAVEAPYVMVPLAR